MGPRLLILSPTPMRGGAEEYLLTVAAAAEREGWDVTVSFELSAGTATLSRDVRNLDGVRLLNMPVRGGRRWGVWGQALATLAALARSRPAVMMVVTPWPTLVGGSAIAAAIARIPTAVVFQLAPSPVEIGSWGRWYRWAQRSQQQWIAVCEQNADAIRASFGLTSGRVRRIYNGGPGRVVLEQGARAAARLSLRRELGLDPAARVVVTVGRLDAQKGHGDLLQALALAPVTDRHSDVTFAWVGEGEMRGSLTSVIAGRGLEQRVKLLGHREDVGSILDGSDLFVLPSHFEGLPFALLEALAHAVPVIASDAGGMPELVRDGIDGLIHRRRSPDDLAAKLGWALDHPERMLELAVSGQARSAQFSSTQMLIETMTVLDQLRSSKG